MTAQEPRVVPISAGPCCGLQPRPGQRQPRLPVLARVLLAMSTDRARDTRARQAIGGRLERHARSSARHLQKHADREAGG